MYSQPILRQELSSGMVCLAEFCEEFYRARVISKGGQGNEPNQVQVSTSTGIWINLGVLKNSHYLQQCHNIRKV